MYWFLAQGAAGRDAVVAHLAGATDERAERGLRILAFALAGESKLAMPAGWAELAQRFEHTNPAAPVALARAELAALFGDEAVLARSRTVLADAQAPLADRRTALERLKRAGDSAAVPLYIALLDDDAFRSTVLPLLAGVADPAVVAGVLRHFAALSDADRAVALATMTSHPAQGAALLAAVQAGALEKEHLTALHARQLRNLRDGEVDRLLDEVWGRTAESAGELRAAMERYRKLYHEAPRWAFSAANGREAFQRLCSTCHLYEGAGGNLGPDLSGSWRNGVDYFIESIVDPNAVVGVDFQLNLITKRDGSVVSGMVERETETAHVVRTATETLNVPRSEIASREVLEQSLMPPGLLDAIPEREVVELLMFLAEPR
jgi:putative heme-binding domain-containing protein